MPDPKYLTHVNYGFGHINATYDGIKVDDPVRLRQISMMKVKYPHLKILLSIGGWEGSNGYSEMAMQPETRARFAADCKRVVDAYHLDGIDIDWEYPTILSKRNSASPYDIENLTLLMRAVRASIGTNKILSMTSLATAKCAVFPEIIEYIDYVNVMAYDMGVPPYHHASLYRSEISGATTVDESIQAHFAVGVPNHKMMLGISFYGEGAERIPRYVLLADVVKLEGYYVKWDPIGKTPFLANNDGALIFSYENPASIVAKAKYALDYNLLGVTVWEYAGDFQQKYLVQTVDKILREKEKEKERDRKVNSK
jgi:chitinase